MNKWIGRNGMWLSSVMGAALAFTPACEPAPTDQLGEEPGAAGERVTSKPDTEAHMAAAGGGGSVDKATDFFELGWDSPDSPWLAYQGTHLCLWSGIGGDFNSDDEYFGAGESIVDWKDWEYWRVYYRAGVSTTRAICSNWDNFVVPSGGVKWISEGGWAEAAGNANATAEAGGWQGDAVTFLRGVKGEMQSNTEYVQINQATTIAGSSVLRVHEEEGDFLDWTFLQGFSHSVFVGVPQRNLARLIGFNSSTGTFVRGTVNSTGTFEFPVSTVSGFSSYWLAGVNQGVCSFTRMAGNFDGGGERVRIFQNGGQWFVQASAAAGKGIYAKVRCMAYDQR